MAQNAAAAQALIIKARADSNLAKAKQVANATRRTMLKPRLELKTN